MAILCDRHYGCTVVLYAAEALFFCFESTLLSAPWCKQLIKYCLYVYWTVVPFVFFLYYHAHVHQSCTQTVWRGGTCRSYSIVAVVATLLFTSSELPCPSWYGSAAVPAQHPVKSWLAASKIPGLPVRITVPHETPGLTTKVRLTLALATSSLFFNLSWLVTSSSVSRVIPVRRQVSQSYRHACPANCYFQVYKVYAYIISY